MVNVQAGAGIGVVINSLRFPGNGIAHKGQLRPPALQRIEAKGHRPGPFQAVQERFIFVAKLDFHPGKKSFRQHSVTSHFVSDEQSIAYRRTFFNSFGIPAQRRSFKMHISLARQKEKLAACRRWQCVAASGGGQCVRQLGGSRYAPGYRSVSLPRC